MPPQPRSYSALYARLAQLRARLVDDRILAANALEHCPMTYTHRRLLLELHETLKLADTLTAYVAHEVHNPALAEERSTNETTP
jgi:hypothetical protein